MTRSSMTTALGLCAALAAAVPAFANDVDVYGGDGRVTAMVKFSDADLHTATGAKRLALRIRVAAAQVCGGDFNPALRNGEGFVHCREASIDRAIRDLGSPMVADALGRSPTTSLARR